MAVFTPGVAVETTTPTISVEGLAPGVHHFRLVVVDEAGNSSIPSNVTVTVRFAAPVVSDFQPHFGAPGQAVTLSGSGLDAPGGRALFGSLAATVTAVAADRMDVTVPSGATTARITVQNDGGSGTSAEAFVVPRARTIQKIARPADADHDPIARELWVSGAGPNTEQQGLLTAIDLANPRIVATIPLPAPAGDIAVSRATEPRLGLVANPGGRSATVFSPVQRGVVRRIALRAEPDGVAITPDGRRGLVVLPSVGRVAVLDLIGLRIETQIAVGKLPSKVVVAPDGALAFVTSTADGTVAAIDMKALTVVAQLPAGGSSGSRPAQVTSARKTFPVWMANAGNATASMALSLTQVKNVALGAAPDCIAADGEGRVAFLAGAASDVLERIDASSLTPKRVRMIAPGGGFKGIATTRDGAVVTIAHPTKAAVSALRATDLRLQAVLQGLGSPQRVIQTDDDLFFCIVDSTGDAVVLLQRASLT